MVCIDIITYSSEYTLILGVDSTQTARDLEAGTTSKHITYKKRILVIKSLLPNAA